MQNQSNTSAGARRSLPDKKRGSLLPLPGFYTSHSHSKKHSVTNEEEDERKTVLVLGATGMVGGALTRALLSYPWLSVKIGTRRPWCSEALLLQTAGCKVAEVDYNYKYSLVQAMKGIMFVFVHTHYWENYSSVLEFIQGKNVVEAAIEAGVQHIIYDGTNYKMPKSGRVCNFLRSRLEIQSFIEQSGIQYTIVVLPFYFENFLNVFRPFEVSHDLFAIPLPLEGRAIPCGCLADMALCICKMILNSASYVGETVVLVSEVLNVETIAQVFTSIQEGRQFFDPFLSVEDFMEFEFPGAKDIGAMFQYYQEMTDMPDVSLTRNLNPHVRKLHSWVLDNCAQISVLLADTRPQEKHVILPYRLRRNSAYVDSSVSVYNLSGVKNEHDGADMTKSGAYPYWKSHLEPEGGEWNQENPAVANFKKMSTVSAGLSVVEEAQNTEQDKPENATLKKTANKHSADRNPTGKAADREVKSK